MPEKCILILLDGLGDRSYQELDFKTPLQSAKTPVLDRMAVESANGLYHAACIGQALPSENAHFIMFGYDIKEFPGRGALEALGAGIEFQHKDVAVLSHFASITESEKKLVLEQGKPVISDGEISEFVEVVREFETGGVRIRFNPAGGIRGIITLHGSVSPFITDSDPFVNNRPLINIQPWAEYRDDPATTITARALKKYLVHVYHKLRVNPVNQERIKNGKLPINCLVTQRAGQLKHITPFADRYGLRGLSMASGPMYWGLGRYIGLDVKKVMDTGNPGDDLAGRIQMAYEYSNRYDFIHVHTKTPDEAAHTKNPLAKKSVIESLDQGIGKVIQPLLEDPELLVIVTADHSTPSSGPLIHSGESVPILFHGSGVRRDRVRQFDEISAASGALGTLRGNELMYMVLNHLNRLKLHGIMDTPIDQPYWPGKYKSFILE
ncbi:MAG: alkaline phosphatase family protein [Desulfobacterales bacterium]|jgi:2,3-bisphosphoglycerate-independent phosphoglycerate mutase